MADRFHAGAKWPNSRSTGAPAQLFCRSDLTGGCPVNSMLGHLLNVKLMIMKDEKKKRFFGRSIVFSLSLLLMIAMCANSIVFGEFIEDFGHIGTVRVFRGQVRDGLDVPVPRASLRIDNLTTGKTYSIDADENGVFKKDDLASGKYRVEVKAAGFNINKYTVKISRHSLIASRKYTVVRLSPGCASGNSGIALVKKVNEPSFRQ